MAKDKDPLKLVQTLADAAEFENSQKVAASVAHLSAEAQRLAVLEQYLSEYRDRRTDNGGTLDVAYMTRQHEFVAALTRAISDQDRRVTDLREQFESTLGLWRDAKSKVSALKQYTGRIDDRERLRSERKEQSTLDDIAGRSSGLR